MARIFETSSVAAGLSTIGDLPVQISRHSVM
jgi:hypothetical protein